MPNSSIVYVGTAAATELTDLGDTLSLALCETAATGAGFDTLLGPRAPCLKMIAKLNEKKQDYRKLTEAGFGAAGGLPGPATAAVT